MISLRRSFNVDRYLAGQPQPEPLALRFRSWAVRLNDRCEAWIDSFDWRGLDIVLGNIAGVGLTGVILYLIFTLVNAFLQGRFNLGGQ
jgi:hypothetical protein